MRTRLAAASIAALVLAAPAAWAAEPKDLEPAKHLTMLELYLRGARDSAKALQIVGTMGATPSDGILIDEVAHCAIDQIGKAEVHLRHLKKMGVGIARMDLHLKKARAAVNKLSAFKQGDEQLSPQEVENLRVAAEHINAHVSDGLRAVEAVATDMGHAILDDIEVRERVPVKGKSAPAGK